MSSKKISSFFQTTTFRLTLWYSLFSMFSLLVLFVSGYFLINRFLIKQIDNNLNESALEFRQLLNIKDINAIQSGFNSEVNSEGERRVFFRYLSFSGKILAASNMDSWQFIKRLNVDYNKYKNIQFEYSTIDGSDRLSDNDVRVLRKQIPGKGVLEIGRVIDNSEGLLQEYIETFGTGFIFMLITGNFIGWILAKKALFGVKRVIEIAENIDDNNLSGRVVLLNEGQEIDDLVKTFNDMLDRVQILFTELSQITDNIAHELRTPITQIKGIAETTLIANSSLEEYKQMTSSIIESSDQLTEIIETMLEIAKTNSGAINFSSEEINLTDIIVNAIELYSTVADMKNICLSTNITEIDPIWINGERSKLQRAISNILDNAIKYSKTGGIIEVAIDKNNNEKLVYISIKDNGIGISSTDLPLIFNRFYRGDKSRSQKGAGLGLSLAMSFIKSHKGTISVESITDKGSIFTITLPLSVNSSSSQQS